MSKQKVLSIIKMLVPLVFLFMLIFEIQRSFTGFPKIIIHVVAGSTMDKLHQSTSIYDVLGDWNVFAYFTTLSHILFVLTFVVAWTFRIKVSKYWINAVFIYQIITFVVFWTSIAPFLPWGQNSYYDYDSFHEHLIVIVMGAVFWWMNRSKNLNILKQFGISMIFMGIYLVFALIIYLVSGQAIYPFLNFGDFFSAGLGVGLSVFLSILVILGIALVVFALSSLLANYQASKEWIVKNMQKTSKFFGRKM